MHELLAGPHNLSGCLMQDRALISKLLGGPAATTMWVHTCTGGFPKSGGDTWNWRTKVPGSLSCSPMASKWKRPLVGALLETVTRRSAAAHQVPSYAHADAGSLCPGAHSCTEQR